MANSLVDGTPELKDALPVAWDFQSLGNAGMLVHQQKAEAQNSLNVLDHAKLFRDVRRVMTEGPCVHMTVNLLRKKKTFKSALN